MYYYYNTLSDFKLHLYLQQHEETKKISTEKRFQAARGSTPVEIFNCATADVKNFSRAVEKHAFDLLRSTAANCVKISLENLQMSAPTSVLPKSVLIVSTKMQRLRAKNRHVL